mmetsp:Transcript_62817/g.159026  ORF Transcript_62817/g.159026 Transcript_62817/m.159026 type:complete len:833 (+) Transcript_62817:79-2577(+)
MKLFIRLAACLAGGLGGAAGLLRPDGGTQVTEPPLKMDGFSVPGLEQSMLLAGQDPKAIANITKIMKPMFEAGLKQVETDHSKSVQDLDAGIIKIKKCRDDWSLQAKIDKSVCKAKGKCNKYKDCYKKRKAEYHALKNFTKNAVETRKTEYRLYKRLECLVRAYANSTGVNKDKLDECVSKIHSTRHLRIRYPRVPRKTRCRAVFKTCKRGRRSRRNQARKLERLARGNLLRLSKKKRRAKRWVNRLRRRVKRSRGKARRHARRSLWAAKRAWKVAIHRVIVARRSWQLRWRKWRAAFRRSVHKAWLRAKRAKHRADIAERAFRRHPKGEAKQRARRLWETARRNWKVALQRANNARRSWMAISQSWKAHWQAWRAAWRRAERRARRAEVQNWRRFLHFTHAQRRARYLADRARTKAWRARGGIRRQKMRSWRAAQHTWVVAWRRAEAARRSWKVARRIWWVRWRVTERQSRSYAWELFSAMLHAKKQAYRAQLEAQQQVGVVARRRAWQIWKVVRRSWTAASRKAQSAYRAWIARWSSWRGALRRSQQRVWRFERQTRSRELYFSRSERLAKRRAILAKHRARRVRDARVRRCAWRAWKAAWHSWKTAWSRANVARQAWSAARQSLASARSRVNAADRSWNSAYRHWRASRQRALHRDQLWTQRLAKNYKRRPREIFSESFEKDYSGNNYMYKTPPRWSKRGGIVVIRSGSAAWGKTTAQQGEYFLGLQGSGARICRWVGHHSRGRAHILRYSINMRRNNPTKRRRPRLMVTISGRSVRVHHFRSYRWRRQSIRYYTRNRNVKICFKNVGPRDRYSTAFLDAISVTSYPRR